jgi:hypothetical protein
MDYDDEFPITDDLLCSFAQSFDLDRQNHSEIKKNASRQGRQSFITTELFDPVADKPSVLDETIKVLFSGRQCNQINLEILYKDRRYIRFDSFDPHCCAFSWLAMS